MRKRFLSLLLAVLTLLPLLSLLPAPSFAAEFSLTRFFTGDTSDWETWGGTTSLVLRANGINADKISEDIDKKSENYRWFLSFNGGESLRIDPATYVYHGSTAITLRFPTYACGFSPSYNPAGASDNGIYYDLSLRVENASGKAVYVASVKNLHSTLTDPVIANTTTLDGSRDGNGFGQSLPSGKSTTALLFTVKNALASTLWEDRGSYRWHLVYEDQNGRHEQDLPPSAFNGNTLFYFEPCLGAPSFIPQRDHTYFVTLELWKEDALCYFAGGTIYGYQMDHDAIYSDKSYNITWIVGKDKLTTSVFEGAIPFYPGSTPKKEHPTPGMRYVFAGWEPKLTPASKNTSYKAVFEEEKTPYSITFSVGSKEFTNTYFCGDVPVYPYTFEEQSSGGLYTLFGGFDQRPSVISADATYKATLLEGVSEAELDALSLSRAEILPGGRAKIFLYAHDPLSSASFLPVYNSSLFTLEEVSFEKGVEGSYEQGVISLSCKENKSGVLLSLLFSCKKGASGGCALDLLTAVYQENARPLLVKHGYLQITSDLPGDATSDGTLDLKDAQAYLEALKLEEPAEGIDDCLPNGRLSITDLTALLNRLSGIPTRLYRGQKDKHTLSYTAMAGGKIAGVANQTLEGATVPLTVTAVPVSNCHLFLGWSDGFGGEKRTDAGLLEDSSFTAIYGLTVPELSLPVIRINTGGTEITSNITYVSARISTENCAEEYQLKNAHGEIRGRGNAAWDSFRTIKPSYKLKFRQEVGLLGVGEKDKDWLLISTYTDKSFLRNYAMYRLGQMLDGVEWTQSLLFVEIYINEDYRGVYLLTEQIEANAARLNLKDEGTNPNKDYLLELDHRASWKGADPITYFEIAGGQQPFVIKSTVNSTTERAFISKQVKLLHDTLMSGNEEKIRKICDIDSLVDNYIIQELSHNRDVGFASFFFYRKDGIFYFGPPWDFDLALGNDRDYGDAQGQIYSNSGRGNHWFESLYKQSWFRTLVSARLKEIEPVLDTLEGEILMMGKALEDAAARNFDRFPVLGTPVFLEPSNIASFKTYYNHVDYLVDWIGKRRTFLEKTFK
ncbi:MAG: CotH kinase family protein [Clostridia bacterium]|nr:CotH kinase family protein [Clostridia bacterium]